MNNRTLFRGLWTALALTFVPLGFAQDGLPVAQPKRLTIIREQVKPGMDAAHARHEAGWPAAFAKANSPDYYLALTSLTGSPEAWFLITRDSFAAEAAAMKRDAKDPVLMAELERLAAGDGVFISGLSVISTVGRPDLSLGKFPEAGKMRFFEVSTFTVRLGQEGKMDQLLKTYAKVRARVSPAASYRFYAVQAGMPESTYIVFQSVTDYAEFDRIQAEHRKVFEVATPEEQKHFDMWGDVVVRSEVNRFRVDPGMSYVSKETRDSDPEFWNAK